MEAALNGGDFISTPHLSDGFAYAQPLNPALV